MVSQVSFSLRKARVDTAPGAAPLAEPRLTANSPNHSQFNEQTALAQRIVT
jgi:hypothetical protein